MPSRAPRSKDHPKNGQPSAFFQATSYETMSGTIEVERKPSRAAFLLILCGLVVGFGIVTLLGMNYL
jgi:hypothetical protein